VVILVIVLDEELADCFSIVDDGELDDVVGVDTNLLLLLLLVL
jgi:hypothetical protein